VAKFSHGSEGTDFLNSGGFLCAQGIWERKKKKQKTKNKNKKTKKTGID
jgi:hypothetical protein